MDSPLPVNYPALGHRPRRFLKPLSPPLLGLANGLFPGPSREPVPLAEPRRTGPDVYHGNSVWRHHVAPAENDHTDQLRPQTTGTDPHDDLDDAHDVRLLHPHVPRWPGSILVDLKSYQYCYAVLCQWLGRLVHLIHSEGTKRGQ